MMNTETRLIPQALNEIKDLIEFQVLEIVRESLKEEPFSAIPGFLNNKLNIQDSIVAGIDEQVKKVLSPIRKKFSTGVIGKQANSFDNLALVDKEELALQLVCDNFIERALDGNKQSLAMVTIRFEFLANQDLEIEDTILSPDALSDIIRLSIKCVDAEYQDKSDFLRLIFNQLLTVYQDLLDDANNAFIANGILTDLNESDGQARYKRKQEKVEAQKKRKSLLASLGGNVKYDENGNPESADMGDVLENLEISESKAEHVIQSSEAAEYINEQDLLKHIDASYKNEISKLEISDEEEQKKVEETHSLANQLMQKASLNNFVLSKKNSSSIGMLSMLFQELFENNDFPSQIKKLLEGLQIPMLKAAILDKNFFADTNSPAQLLLNRLAEFGSSWVPEKDPDSDKAYKQLAGIISMVNSKFDNTYEVFVDALFELEDFLKNHQAKMARIESRIVAMEKAVARQDRAKHEAERHIKIVFKRFKLAEALNDFLYEPWKNVLFFFHNKYDNSTNLEWKNAIQAELELVRVLNASPNNDKKKAVYALQEQMLAIGQNKSAVNGVLNKIIPFVKKTEKSVEKLEVEEKAKEIIELKKKANKDQKSSNAFVDEVRDKATINDLDKPILNETAANDEDDLLIDKDRLIEILQDKLSVGMWLNDFSKGEKEKVKIAAYIKHTDTYVLVNRKGAKHASFNSLEMYENLENESLQLIESALAFDRSLESVIVGLRK